MTQQEFMDEFLSLPSDAQRKVAEFISVLKQKYQTAQPAAKEHNKVAEDEFIGMWRDREDLAGGDWVRRIRKNEWSK